MARKALSGRWHVYFKKCCKFKPWKAEKGYGKHRVRRGFATQEDAIAYATVMDGVSREKDKPLLTLDPKDTVRWPLMQTVAEQLLKVEPESTEMAEWQSLIHANPSTRKTLHLMKPLIDYCLDRHKPEFMVKAVFGKLSTTQSSFTVQQMVDARRTQKAKKNARLGTDREKKRAKGHEGQVIEVGDSLIKFFGPDRDIDSITAADMEAWEIEYLKTHRKKDGSEIARTTMEGRIGLASGHFSAVQDLGWTGEPPCREQKVANAKETVILNFHEISGILIALRYIDPNACLAFAIELYGFLRSLESLWVRKADILLEDSLLHVRVPKLTSNHAKRSKTEFSMDTVQIIDTLHQWICYLQGGVVDYIWPQVQNKNEGKTSFNKRLKKARDVAQCTRWNHKDTARHTGGSMAYVLGVPIEDIREQMRHAFGSLVTQARYLREMAPRDAAAILLITPANLGWIAGPYPYTPPKHNAKHLGHTLRLDHTREDHISLAAEYIPKLRARDAEIRAALGID